MDDKTRLIDFVRGLFEDLPLHIDLHQRRGGDLLIEKPVGIDQKLIRRPRHAKGDVIVDEMRPAKVCGQTIGRSKIAASLPFLAAHVITF